MKIAFDLSSILWTALRVGKDVDGQEIIHKDKKVWVNSAAYGYENAINLVVSALKEFDLTPIDCIFAQEGVSSKAPRLAICPKYKANRDDKPVEELKEFHKLKDLFLGVFASLGALTVIQDYAEGDDTLGFLAANTEEDLIIVTNDNDLAALNGKNSFGAEVGVRVNGFIGVNKYGDFPHHHITLYKAMVGDTSDGITGIPGFGPKAWEQFVSRFGVAGMDMLVSLINKRSLDDLFADSQQDKFIKKIFDGAADLIRCYKLARIYPEWVNTQLNPLQWKPGMVAGRVTDERLKPWAASRRLVTTKNWEAFKPWALQQIAKRPWMPLDIETSTPDASDEWLEAQGDPDGVDTIGSRLSGMSLTFGVNMHYTVYIAVDHTETECVPVTDVRDFLADVAKLGTKLVIHNTNFEGPVLYNEWGKDWLENGYHGFLPNWTDTKFWASYVDENDKLGLKHLSKKWLGYNQVDYATTTTLQARPGVLKGGKFRGEVAVVDVPAVHDAEGKETTPAVVHMEERVQYKMRELTAAHVFDYACDDTVTTGALYNFFRIFCMLEHTAEVLETVEIEASYLHAQSYVTGFKCDLKRMAELVAEDDATHDSALERLDTYLISKGWAGTICPVFDSAISAKQIKEAYSIVTGEVLDTAVRTPSKLLVLFEEAQPLLHSLMADALQGRPEGLNRYVKSKFSGKPAFNSGSPKQMANLLYNVMGAPVKVYNKPTEKMKEAGNYQGTPSTDALAIAYAMRDCEQPEVKTALEALKLVKMVQTRRSLYYSSYPYFVHWKTGRVHPSHNQCATNTRRASSSKPNMQQMPKHPKVEGQPAKFREVIAPHKKDAVVVSMDFVAQELRVIADYSQDPNLLACYVGDNLKDMHTLTGLGIAETEGLTWSYEEFVMYLSESTTEAHKKAKALRALGKKTNFTTEYGAQAPKLAATLMVDEITAQSYLDAREDAFPIAKAWKQEVIADARGCGYTKSKLGAVRHLSRFFMSRNRTESSKAERQSVNYKIQGSSAEMTKLAEGRMWKAGLTSKYDCEIIGPIHDEIVSSCAIENLYEFIPEMHRCMVQQYADMRVPVLSSISFGSSFGLQIEIGEQPTKEAIDYGLLELSKLMKKETT